MSLRERWDLRLGHSQAEKHPGLFDRPPRRMPEEQAVIDAKLRKLLGDEREKKTAPLAAPTPPAATR